jgi:hypothetical protein
LLFASTAVPQQEGLGSLHLTHLKQQQELQQQVQQIHPFQKSQKNGLQQALRGMLQDWAPVAL